MSESPRGWLPTLIIATGSIGLAGAMVTDGLAVAGRHLGLPFAGSIEISQAFVIIMAASAIAYASLDDHHAAVDLVFQRLPKWLQCAALRVNAFLTLAFFAALIAGSGWILTEGWAGGEQTELLHVPLRWFRLFWIVMSVISAGAFAIGVVRRPKVD
jgi:TRAP-type C4-dicarboxylate transport system permease small subunit